MRAVAVIALLLVVLGWCALALVLRIQGYPEFQHLYPRWRPSAIWLREYGPWLMLAVPMWAFLAVWCSERLRSEALETGFVIAGIAMCCIVLFAFIWAAANPRFPRGLPRSGATSEPAT